MTSIKENYDTIVSKVRQTAQGCGRDPQSVSLIAVSKLKSVEDIQTCIAAGGRHFGENYIQEAIRKIDIIGKDNAIWHFIGHLQSNKAKFAVPYFEYIHTVDSVKLAREIDKQAKKINKIQKVFIQANIGDESTKTGARNDDLIDLVKEISGFENLSIQGLMCMPPFFDDPEDARPYFKKLVEIQDEIINLNLENISMSHLSMGMSNDFEVAIEEGATMVRVGTSIFGSRN